MDKGAIRRRCPDREDDVKKYKFDNIESIQSNVKVSYAIISKL